MKKLVIEETGRTIEACVNLYDRYITIKEELDDELESITLTYNEFYQIYYLLIDRSKMKSAI